MKNITIKKLLNIALIHLIPATLVQADIISFDIDVDNRYERTIQNNFDGTNIDNTDREFLNNNSFSTEISFDLFSAHNQAQQQFEHQFQDNGNTLANWSTVFDFTSQDIFTPFNSELLALIDLNDYENISQQNLIIADGTYHYFDPLDDSDVRERITFRQEIFGSTITSTANGDSQQSFDYWREFTIDLPSPLSFAQRTIFDSTSTDEILSRLSGSSVSFQTYLAQHTFADNPSIANASFQSLEVGFQGSGTFQLQNAQQVPEPSSISLFLAFLLLAYFRRTNLLNK